MELLVGGPYTRDKEEHLFGHAALRVVVGSKDITYDFGRYGKTWGTFDSEGEGVLNVWTSFKTYISGENSLGRTTTGFVYNLERSKAEPSQYREMRGLSWAERQAARTQKWTQDGIFMPADLQAMLEGNTEARYDKKNVY
ncbi:hypothetical protein [Pseudomonas hormoni]